MRYQRLFKENNTNIMSQLKKYIGKNLSDFIEKISFYKQSKSNLKGF